MLWTCMACTTRYAPGLARCPHCGSTDYQEDGMPKSHADGTVTDAARDAELAELDTTEAEFDAALAESEPAEIVAEQPDQAEQPATRKRTRKA